jgi:DNA-binding CsgD family transcriptional regulator
LKLALQGKNSTEIAEILGVSKSSIDHSEGWKQRKKAIT